MKMERRKKFVGKKTLFWVVVMMQLAMFTQAANVTDTIQIEDTEFAWSAWGPWSGCSRTCGGGAAVQTRECLPRSHKSGNIESEVAITESSHAHGCLGPSKRYHECNTKPCAGEERDMRAAQCSAYDKRPFRGRFYIWVPYIDGDSPCTLNCRPSGQQFYASLSLVQDGTPCTKPGYRAICVQGTCKNCQAGRHIFI